MVINNKKLFQKFFILMSSLIYGLLVYSVVEYWSFDYPALVETITVYRINGDVSFLYSLGNNTVILSIWDLFFYNLSPDKTISLLYGFAASIRFLVFFSLFRFQLSLPAFLATMVFMDLNVCRYSLVVSFLILTLRTLGPIKSSILFFSLHILSPAIIFMISAWNKYWQIIILICIFALTLILPSLFTRHFDLSGAESFPRITYIFIFFSLILLVAFHKDIAKYRFNYLVLILGISIFIFSKVPFANAYYLRFALLAFDSLIILIAFYYSGLRDLSSLKVTSIKYGIYFGVCILSFMYTSLLIGGNIWRFF